MMFADSRGLFKANSTVDQSGPDELVKTSIDSGINFFDTADNYTQRSSQRHIVRKLIRSARRNPSLGCRTAAQSADAGAGVPDLIATARDAGMMVIHVVVAFLPGHPEVSPRNPVFIGGRGQTECWRPGAKAPRSI
jgi:hypothetical protein